MPKLQLKRHEQILERMISRVVARTDLSDLDDASAVKHLLSAFAREMDDGYFQMTRLTDLFSIDSAAGDDLNERAKDIQPATLTRIGTRRSIGLIVFSRATNTGITDVIPTGTAIKTADGAVFNTTQQAQITNTSPEQITGHGVGRDSNLVSATAATPGLAGNIAPQVAIKFVSKPPNINEVENPSAFTNGRDEETNDEFRTRLRDFVNALAKSTVQALEFVAIGIQDPTPSVDKQVIFSHVFEDPIDRGNVILYVDDGAGTAATRQTNTAENVTLGLLGPPLDSAVGGEEFLSLDEKPVDQSQPFTLTSDSRGVLTLGVDYFLNPASGLIFFVPALIPTEVITATTYDTFTGLIQEAQKVVDGDKADRQNYPGWRAGGTIVRVLPPVVVQATTTAVLSVQEGFDRAAVVVEAKAAVSAYINGLGISGDIIRNELIEQIMSVPGVVDLSLTVPSANIPVLDNEIPRIIDADNNIT